MYEDSMGVTRTIRNDPEIRQKIKKFAGDGKKPKDYSSLHAE